MLCQTVIIIIIIIIITILSRPNKVRQSNCPSVRQSVHAYVRAYVRPSKRSFFHFNEIWRVCRGRYVMHDGMPYDPIQGQGQGHEPYKVGNPSIFKRYLLSHLQWGLATDH